jgi:very-short-patch-repair endonuclease
MASNSKDLSMKSDRKISDTKKPKSNLEIIKHCVLNIENNRDNPQKVLTNIKWLCELFETKDLNPIQLTHLISLLYKLEFLWWSEDQVYSEKLKYLLDVCLLDFQRKLSRYRANDFKKKLSHPEFTLKELVINLISLSKLPIDWCSDKNKPLLNAILLKLPSILDEQLTTTKEQIGDDSEKKELGFENLTSIIHALSNLLFSIKRHSPLIQLLLREMNEYYSSFNENDVAKSWQGLAVLKARGYVFDEKTTAMFEYCNSRVEKLCRASNISVGQEIVTKKILTLLSNDALKDLKIEYRLGVYTLDLAFCKYRLNIEIDGPHHFAFGELRFSDSVRDFVLAKLKDFLVIIIRLSEIRELDKSKSESFLRAKLDIIPGLLKSAETKDSRERSNLLFGINQQLLQLSSNAEEETIGSLLPEKKTQKEVYLQQSSCSQPSFFQSVQNMSNT